MVIENRKLCNSKVKQLLFARKQFTGVRSSKTKMISMKNQVLDVLVSKVDKVIDNIKLWHGYSSRVIEYFHIYYIILIEKHALKKENSFCRLNDI